MCVQIGCVVEGRGDLPSVPILLRRFAERVDPALIVNAPAPLRVSKNKLLKPNELERAVKLLGSRVAPHGGILILVDSDKDCPATVAPALLQRAVQVRADLPIGLALAKCEFEAWFLAAAESLGGQRGLPKTLQPPADPQRRPWRQRMAPRSDANRQKVPRNARPASPHAALRHGFGANPLGVLR